MLYLHGLGVTQDYQVARMWFEKSACSNDSRAMNNLGYMYNYGIGVPKDQAKAVVWYQKAAKFGSPEAKTDLALLYFKGQGGLEHNDKKGMELLIQAAQQGEREAQNNLAIIYSKGDVSFRDYAKSYAWYSVAFANGKLSAKEQQSEISRKMNADELERANKLAHEYILKYSQHIYGYSNE
ncbi:sel1 repeat family protein [Salmonella enterica subsp. enterica]|nr:sel1 repeat family protein [Salmonella enterica subsp. enterica serovar Kalamu]